MLFRSIFGSCTKRTRTFCCFNSRPSRIINEQGRAQLGTPWGSAQSPRCDGFTIDELQRLNFAAMDLTEFYADIVRTGHTSITVNVEVYATRNPREVVNVRVTEATLTYVAVGEDRRPRPLPDADPGV